MIKLKNTFQREVVCRLRMFVFVRGKKDNTHVFQKKVIFIYMQDIQTFSIKHSPTHVTLHDPEETTLQNIHRKPMQHMTLHKNVQNSNRCRLYKTLQRNTELPKVTVSESVNICLHGCTLKYVCTCNLSVFLTQHAGSKNDGKQ